MRKTSVKGTCPECGKDLVLQDVALNSCGGYMLKGIRTLWLCNCGFQIQSHKSLAEWLDILKVKLPEKFIHKDKIVHTFKVPVAKVNDALIKFCL
jgi:ssDNA-binding Zn-finger/Zn-ribbon topoisomerase 1